MKRLIPFAAALLLTAGCQSGFRTATYTDDQAMPLEEGSADSLILSVALDYPIKGAGEDVLNRITHGILGTVFDLEEEPGSVEETALRYVDDLKDAYFNENEGQAGETQAGVATWEDRINGKK